MTTCRECERFTDEWHRSLCDGTAVVHGQPVSKEQTTLFRELNGLAPLGESQEEWTISMKSRGLGDTIAKFTYFTGIHHVVKAVTAATGVDCGCGKRQADINAAIPFKQ